MIFDGSLGFFSGFQWFVNGSPTIPGSRKGLYLTISAAASPQGPQAIVEGRFKTPPLDQIGLDGLTGRQRWIRWRRRWVLSAAVGFFLEDPGGSLVIEVFDDLLGLWFLGKIHGKIMGRWGLNGIYMDLWALYWDIITTNLRFECVWKWEMDPGTGTFNGDHRDNDIDSLDLGVPYFQTNPYGLGKFFRSVPFCSHQISCWDLWMFMPSKYGNSRFWPIAI